MKVDSYRKNARRTVTLTNGETVEVRSMNVSELAAGNVPVAGANEEDVKASYAKIAQMTRIIMLNCVFLGAAEIEEGGVKKTILQRIVDKRPEECGPGEIAWNEFDPEDINLIVTAVKNEKGNAATAATFQEASGVTGKS